MSVNINELGRCIALKAEVALSYVPVLLAQLDADGREIFGVVLQAMREGGYDDGFRDGQQAKGRAT